LVFAPVMLVAEPVPKDNVVAAEPQPAAPDSVVVVTIAPRHVSVDSAIQIQSTDVPRAPVRAPLSMTLLALGAVAGTTMRAKMQVRSVERPHEGYDMERLTMAPVSGPGAYGPNGESEDNTFARFTPAGSLSLDIANPDLHGKFAQGQAYYVDFTPAE
jgi:hypothetical protein